MLYKGSSLNGQPASMSPLSKPSSVVQKFLLVALWIAAAVSVPVHNRFEAPAWDVHIYLQAVHSITIGHDPYLDAISIQEKVYAERNLHPDAPTPFSYVYSPITLPVVKLVAVSPLWLSGLIYWGLYLAGLLAQLWVGIHAAAPRAVDPLERRFLLLLAPVAAFFPGWLASDILWSGNVAFILYGLVLLCAGLGWRRNRWLPFYIAVLLASCVKAPLLSLVAIPVFSARKQAVPAALTVISGVVLFFGQYLVWPSLFQHYLKAVELQFSLNRDFGSSPAGLLSGFLYDHHIPYDPASLIFYAAYAIAICAVLFRISRRFHQGLLSLAQVIPVLLTGVILLNPRILEYDEIALTLPLTLIGWRFLRVFTPPRRAATFLTLAFFIVNAIAFQGWSIWKLTEGPLLVLFFAAGAWTLFRAASQRDRSVGLPLEAPTNVQV
jgi:hypothetical protein